LLFAEGDSVIPLPDNFRFTAETYVPLRFNTGKYLSIIQPRIDYSYRRDVQYVESEEKYSTGAHYLYYYLYGSAYLRKGIRDIIPRVGFVTTLGYYHAPFRNQVYGSVSQIGFTGFLPGFMKHHSVKLSVQYQKQYPLDMARPAFINLIAIPRGLRNIFGEVMTRTSVDYVTPLVYPDLSLTALLYLKRIRAAFWADHLTGSNVIITEPDPHYENRNYTTVGFDLVADFHLLRIDFPISAGARFYFEPETGTRGIEVIYSIDIN
jgi:hypothetical protein